MLLGGNVRCLTFQLILGVNVLPGYLDLQPLTLMDDTCSVKADCVVEKWKKVILKHSEDEGSHDYQRFS